MSEEDAGALGESVTEGKTLPEGCLLRLLLVFKIDLSIVR
jgi:hypothetical protein